MKNIIMLRIRKPYNSLLKLTNADTKQQHRMEEYLYWAWFFMMNGTWD